ncbi:DUF4400 domain-containing protein [Candidatus Accumulibacter phosphatis]|uniref:DUF4400 domain-containing protein n=1 Tax=Candidatus Accumulibacter contiguus TaxID=2954381 RepID=A0ABX1T9E7_9PROT|nr:DUF4400 domain-containing protein [Candidatus Accumulibacter contiguus]NMQ06280.1 DUF4400 domain-containing protein [Candidatus Accumulibacter contiguus]
MNGARREAAASTFVVVALVLGIVVVWALIPSAAIRSAWVAERAGVYAVTGAGEDVLFRRTLDDLQSSLASDFQGWLGDVRSIRRGPWDPAGFSDWLQGRVVVTWLWVGLIAYRLQVLMGWLLPGMPLTMAAYLDGQFVREIRKYAFVAQSPIRHSLAMRVLWIVLIGFVAWLILPLPMPAVLPPLLILAIAYALWLWVSNLQKRL